MNVIFEIIVEVIGWILEAFWVHSKDSFLVKVLKICFIIAILIAIALIFGF